MEGLISLDSYLEHINKRHGTGTIGKLDNLHTEVADVEVVSTGSLSLDIALGVGGLPRGRCIEIYGPESSGKTTLALSVIAQSQKKGNKCCFIDVEHAIDTKWAKKIGVETQELYFTQPNSAEEALEILDALVNSGQFEVIVVDSIAALVPKAELEGDMGASHVGLQARLMSQALRKLTSSIKNTNTTVIFINQLRMKIGVMFGSPEVTTGGLALKYYASVRLDVRKIAQIKMKDDIVGNQIRVKVVKNKVGPAFREGLFDIEYATGISRVGEIVDIGVKEKIIEKGGSWYTYGEQTLGQGREKVKAFLEENPELRDEIDKKIRDVVIKTTNVQADVKGEKEMDEDDEDMDEVLFDLEEELEAAEADIEADEEEKE